MAGFDRVKSAMTTLRAEFSVPVDRINPADLFWPLDRLDVEIDDNRLVVAAHQDAFERLLGRSVNLLVWHIRRHEDEVARTGFGDVFEMVAHRIRARPLRT